MDNFTGMWNPNHNPQLERECESSMGPINQQIRYPPPPLPQTFQTSVGHFYPYSTLSYPPPSLPPPPGLPPVAFCPSVPPPQLGASQSYPVSLSVGSETEQFEKDKQWLKNWLSQSRLQPTPKTSSSSSSVKLIDIHPILVKCSSAIKELQQLHQQLSTLSGCAEETKWDSLMAEINQKKAALAVLVSNIRSLNLAAIKSKLSKRAKKRGRLRRKKAKVKELKQAEQARRKTLHQRADAWLADMRLAVEREHREEELRREADAVLGEVTRKQTEAKRQVCLLDALIKLRQVRAQRAAMDSYNQHVLTDHSAKKFATVIERVRKMWKSQLKEYAGEERGLRVMLQESATQKSDARCQRVNSNLDKWHKAIFGQSQRASRSSSKTDVHQLVIVRAEWDKYVVPPSGAARAPMASSIPIGWLIPQEPSSVLWRPYCAAYVKGD